MANVMSRDDYLRSLGLRYNEGDGDSAGAWLSEEGNRLNNMEQFDNNYDQYVADAYRQQYGGNTASVQDLDSILTQMSTSAGQGRQGAVISPERREQILQAAGQRGFQNISELSQYLTPQELQGWQQYKQYVDKENADLDLFTYAPLIGGAVLGAGALGAFGGAGAEAAAAGAGDAAWGVNAATGAAGEGLTLGGAQPWWADLGSIGMGDPLTAAGIGGGATAAGTGIGMGAAGDILTQAAGSAPWGVNPSNVATTAMTQAGGSAIERIMNGTATPADYAQLAGGLGSAGLGMLGANAQGNVYSDVAQKYLDMGAPGRAQYDTYTNPNFDITTLPGLQSAMDTAANSASRSWSARAGNPADSPTAQAEIQKYLMGSVALPQYNTAVSQALTRGGMGTNTAGTNDTAAAGQTGGMYNAAGYGLGQLTQPKNPYEDAMKGLLGGFKLNQGMSF